MKQLTLLIAMAAVIGLRAGNNGDSASGSMKIKGIDFRYGLGSYHLNQKDEVNLLKKLSNDPNNYNRFDEARVNNLNDGLSDIYLGFVMVPSYYIKNRLFYREEFRIGVSYTTLNSVSDVYLNFDTVQNGLQKEVRTFDYHYKFHSERVHFSYLLNSRISKKNFAFYGGIGGSFGFVTWQTNYRSNSNSGSGIYRTELLTLKNTAVSGNSKVIPLENFTTQSLNIFVPLGFKYNLSCEINLFAEAHAGLHYYLKGLRKDGVWIPNMLFNFGFRYKLIDESVLHKEADVFW
jgi:hypothetical protein